MPTTPELLIAFLSAQLLQWAKRSKHPWLAAIRFNTSGLNRAVSIALAGLAALGISLTATGSADAGWQVLIQVPAIGSLGAALWLWVKQWCLQHLIYRTGVK